MYLKKHFWRFATISGLLLALLLLVGSVLYVSGAKRRVLTFSSESPNANYDLRIHHSKQWEESSHGYLYGLQYDGAIINHSPYDLAQWQIHIELADGSRCHVDSFWNCALTSKDGVLTVSPLEHNRPVSSGGEQTFGFVLYSNQLSSIASFTVSVTRRISLPQLPAFWVSICLIVLVLFGDLALLFARIRTRQYLQKQQEAQKIIDQTFSTFAKIIDAKDPYTNGHSQRVALYSRELARRLGLSEDDQQNIYYAGMLHDIGKIGIPDSILNKKGALTAEERCIVESHVTIGGEILESFTAIPCIRDGARYHHERYDGRGYSCGLCKEDIPLFARIICVADCFDAMSSERCYRPKMKSDAIIRELQEGSGSQFDPTIVPHMLRMIEEQIAPLPPVSSRPAFAGAFSPESLH